MALRKRWLLGFPAVLVLAGAARLTSIPAVIKAGSPPIRAVRLGHLGQQLQISTRAHSQSLE
jgi:hypothetical protein